MSKKTDLYINEDDYGFKCDGCGKELSGKYITGIESCCGGGCQRSLCFDCILECYKMIFELKEDMDIIKITRDEWNKICIILNSFDEIKLSLVLLESKIKNGV